MTRDLTLLDITLVLCLWTLGLAAIVGCLAITVRGIRWQHEQRRTIRLLEEQAIAATRDMAGADR